MKIINYISTISIPLIITIIIAVAIKEKKKVYNIFLEGVKDGIEIVVKLFPTLLAIFIAVGMLRSSDTINIIANLTKFMMNKTGFPAEVLPLALLKPVSGSASMAIATDIMKNYGVDSLIGKIAATIMSSTETTIYVIAVYTGSVGIKKTRFVLAVALLADLVGIITSVLIWNIID